MSDAVGQHFLVTQRTAGQLSHQRLKSPESLRRHCVDHTFEEAVPVPVEAHFLGPLFGGHCEDAGAVEAAVGTVGGGQPPTADHIPRGRPHPVIKGREMFAVIGQPVLGHPVQAVAVDDGDAGSAGSGGLDPGLEGGGSRECGAAGSAPLGHKCRGWHVELKQPCPTVSCNQTHTPSHTLTD